MVCFRYSRSQLRVATQGRHSRSPLKVAAQGRHSRWPLYVKTVTIYTSFRIICLKRSLVIKKNLGSFKGPKGKILYVFAIQGRHSRSPLKVATQGRRSRWPLKVATQSGNSMLKRSLDRQLFALYVKNGHWL
jgi:hypothetical protein